eukprot:Pgem_evm1s11372
MKENFPDPKDLKKWTFEPRAMVYKTENEKKVIGFLSWVQTPKAPLRVRKTSVLPSRFGPDNWGISNELGALTDEIDLRIVQGISDDFKLAQKVGNYEFLDERLKIWETHNEKMKKAVSLQQKYNVAAQFDAESKYHTLTKEWKFQPTKDIENMHKELQTSFVEIEELLNNNENFSNDMFQKQKQAQSKITDMAKAIDEELVK